MILVKAYADLRKYLNVDNVGESVEFDNKDEKIKIEKIAIALNIPFNEISIILINGEHATFDDYAQNGDTVVFFSPVDGG